MKTVNTQKSRVSNNGVNSFLLKQLAIIVSLTFSLLLAFHFFKHQTILVVPSQHQLSWASKLLSLVHSTVTLVIVTLFLKKAINLAIWRYGINITRAYLIASSLVHVFYPETSHSMVLDFMHHITVFLITLYIDQYPRYIAMGLLCEVSQAPLYLTWYMLKWGLQHTVTCQLLVLLTFVTYLIGRVFLFTYLFWKMWGHYRKKECNTRLIEAIGILPILLLNYYWFFLLLQKAYTQLC